MAKHGMSVDSVKSTLNELEVNKDRGKPTRAVFTKTSGKKGGKGGFKPPSR